MAHLSVLLWVGEGRWFVLLDACPLVVEVIAVLLAPSCSSGAAVVADAAAGAAAGLRPTEYLTF